MDYLHSIFHNLMYFGPDSVLPICLGILVFGLIVWNVVQTGRISDLIAENDDLWDDLTVAVQKIPKRDQKGKFQKRKQTKED